MKINPRTKKIILFFIEYTKQRITRIFFPDNRLDYAPDGWKTFLSSSSEEGWNSLNIVAAEKAKWDIFCSHVNSDGPLGFNHESSNMTEARNIISHNIYITYGYVLALAAHSKLSVSVLDYGGSLGHYYQIGKALLPDLEIRFSCKETSNMAETGRLINPGVQWFTDDSCLENKYDLVMITSSLQYIEDWKKSLKSISSAVGEYLYLTRIPVIEKNVSFVAIQRNYGTEMLHWQFNKDELLKVITDEGFIIVREFIVGERPYIKHAPEQCESRGWLFKKLK